MINIIEEKIQHIPILRIESSITEEQAPQALVIAYHGWTHSKDEDVLLGIELAKQGLTVLMPDAPQHGAYPNRQVPVDPMTFPRILLGAVADVALILEDISQQVASTVPIYICGISMGGIIAGLCLSKYNQLQAAGILMGATNPSGFLQALIEYQGVPDHILQESQIQAELEEVNALDLALHPDRLNFRPLYLWHAKNDSTVPFQFNQSFLTQLKQGKLSRRLDLHIDESGGHKVPYQRILELGQFFNEIE